MKTNTPNPLVPQGTFPDQRGKSHIRLAVFAILAVHLVLLAVLLQLGCNKKNSDMALNTDTNIYQPVVPTDTNPFTPPPPTNVAPPVPEVTNIAPPPDTSVVPPPPPPPPPPAAEGEREYVIVKGDSFYTLAKKFGVSSKAIAAANPGVDSTRLKIGQKIKIPAGVSGSSTKVLSASAGTEGAERIHVVKSGEKLYTIAKAEGTTVKAIQAANNLHTTRILVGQKLKIPAKAAAPTAPVTEPLTSTPSAPGVPPPIQ